VKQRTERLGAVGSRSRAKEAFATPRDGPRLAIRPLDAPANSRAAAPTSATSGRPPALRRADRPAHRRPPSRCDRTILARRPTDRSQPHSRACADRSAQRGSCEQASLSRRSTHRWSRPADLEGHDLNGLRRHWRAHLGGEPNQLVRYRRKGDGRSRRRAGIADRSAAGPSWADSAPTGCTSGRAEVRAKAAIPLRVQNRLHRTDGELFQRSARVTWA
jgi:hypothetical protein